jgi:hypothetical protein
MLQKNKYLKKNQNFKKILKLPVPTVCAMPMALEPTQRPHTLMATMPTATVGQAYANGF